MLYSSLCLVALTYHFSSTQPLLMFSDRSRILLLKESSKNRPSATVLINLIFCHGRFLYYKSVKYRQNIKGARDEENNMSVYGIVNVDRMFDKTHYNIK
jgi:hypothetical protein